MSKDKVNHIINEIIKANQMEDSIKNTLLNFSYDYNKIVLISIGKAAWIMAKSTLDVLKEKITGGIVITKYGHSFGNLNNIQIYEAGHPLIDENTIYATNKVIELVKGLKENDLIIFLISGGGSALFELPNIQLSELIEINERLLKSGANIKEINIIRKRFSLVKGGKFASLVYPIPILNLILSDVLSNELDLIASGPTVSDNSTLTEALTIIKKYNIKLSKKANEVLLKSEPIKVLNSQSFIIGDITSLINSTKNILEKEGYFVKEIKERFSEEAKDVGLRLGQLALENINTKIPLAIIAGGESVVKVSGKGKGGRNQELSLAAAQIIKGTDNITLIAYASDGTDGPTEAAGGFVDGNTVSELKIKGYKIKDVLKDNNSYNALKAINRLIVTGPTNTNVNDLVIILMEPKTIEKV